MNLEGTFEDVDNQIIVRKFNVTVKSESREMVANWAPGRGIENYVASAIIEARKPRMEEAGCCGSSCGG